MKNKGAEQETVRLLGVLKKGRSMNEESGKKLLADRRAKLDGPVAGAVSVPPAKEKSRNLLGPHRRREESWEQYIDRRINDAPDADYQARHQKLEEWVKQHSLQEDVLQEQYNRMHCVDREGADLPTGLLTVHGYLWRDGFRPGSGPTDCYHAYLDSKGRKFEVDEREADDRTTEPTIVETPYMLHCPRIGRDPELNPDGRGYFLTDEVNRLGAVKCCDQIVCVAPAANLDSLVGKHLRFACTVECIRETYREDDSCFDRVYLVPMGEAFEVDLFGRARRTGTSRRKCSRGARRRSCILMMSWTNSCQGRRKDRRRRRRPSRSTG